MTTDRSVNPWLKLAVVDYDGHMAEVGQSELLADTFSDVLKKRPFQKGLCVLGAATGNGFARIPVQKNQRLVAVDINLTYLAKLRARHGERLPHLETQACDILRCSFPAGSFDHIHAALFFEYVDPLTVLRHIRPWLTFDGTLSVVLQCPVDNADQISPSSFPGVHVLDGLLRLVDPEHFRDAASEAGFVCQSSWQETMHSGKQFEVMLLGTSG